MDILKGLTQSLYPGQRVIKVDGWQNADKYPVPHDCEVIMLDTTEDYIYMKKVDINGGEKFARYKIIEDPIPVFNPDKFVTIEQFNQLREENEKFQEEVLSAIYSQQQQRTATSTADSGYKSSSK